MEHLEPLVMTATLLLLPLVPAIILYYLLSPKAGGVAAKEGDAGGEVESGTLGPWRVRLRFNVVGSTATYVILLVAATWIHRDAESMRLQAARLQAEALQDQQAWIVEVPVNLRAPGGAAIVASQGQTQRCRSG